EPLLVSTFSQCSLTAATDLSSGIGLWCSLSLPHSTTSLRRSRWVVFWATYERSASMRHLLRDLIVGRDPPLEPRTASDVKASRRRPGRELGASARRPDPDRATARRGPSTRAARSRAPPSVRSRAR